MPFIVAHRGYKARYPENTMAAFEAAIASGAHAVECDIQFSRDVIPVVIHDVELSRTTASSAQVYDLDHGEITTIAADKEIASAPSVDVRVPLLSDLLVLASRYPEVQFFIEIKSESLHYFGLDVVMPKIEAMLKDFSSQCIVISFEMQALEHVKQHSDLKIGWVLHQYDDQHYQMAVKLKPHYLIVNYTKLTPRLAPWAGPWQWMIYEVNDALLAESWIKAGVDYIETARVADLREYHYFDPSPVVSAGE